MEKNKITKAQQIKDIIEPIPADMFIPFNYGEDNNGKKSCFLGHIHRKLNKSKKILGCIYVNDPNDSFGDENGYGARQLTTNFLAEKHGIYANGATVNNYNNINGYTEPVIKDRVMHLINDMIAEGY
jgi:hypothetical protein